MCCQPALYFVILLTIKKRQPVFLRTFSKQLSRKPVMQSQSPLPSWTNLPGALTRSFSPSGVYRICSNTQRHKFAHVSFKVGAIISSTNCSVWCNVAFTIIGMNLTVCATVLFFFTMWLCPVGRGNKCRYGRLLFNTRFCVTTPASPSQFLTSFIVVAPFGYGLLWSTSLVYRTPKKSLCSWLPLLRKPFPPFPTSNPSLPANRETKG